MTKITRESNVEDLRKELLGLYGSLKSGKTGISEAKTFANVAGKVLSMAKGQMEYNKMLRSQEKIPFFEVPSK